MAGNKDGTATIRRARCKGRILLLMKGEDKGKVVVMDVNSGDYEIDYDDAASLFNRLERRPDAFHMVGAGRLSRGASRSQYNEDIAASRKA